MEIRIRRKNRGRGEGERKKVFFIKFTAFEFLLFFQYTKGSVSSYIHESSKLFRIEFSINSFNSVSTSFFFPSNEKPENIINLVSRMDFPSKLYEVKASGVLQVAQRGEESEKGQGVEGVRTENTKAAFSFFFSFFWKGITSKLRKLIPTVLLLFPSEL